MKALDSTKISHELSYRITICNCKSHSRKSKTEPIQRAQKGLAYICTYVLLVLHVRIHIFYALFAETEMVTSTASNEISFTISYAFI